MNKRHKEQHIIEKIGWLRAAVMGANDGIISTASLVPGAASAHAAHGNIMLKGIAGLTAGAMSTATGGMFLYTRRQMPNAPRLRRRPLRLKRILKVKNVNLLPFMCRRGLHLPLAKEVADQLMAHDAIGAHTCDKFAIP